MKIKSGISVLPLLHSPFFIKDSNYEREQQTLSLSSAQLIKLEKIKLGQELHDDVNAQLAVAQLYLKYALNKSNNCNKVLQLALSCVTNAIESIRNISSGMVSEPDTKFNLVSNIREFAQKISATKIFKIRCRFSDNLNDATVTLEQRICLYRIVEEQMNNIIKYSKAKNVQINIQLKQNKCIMNIKDDGVGCSWKTSSVGIGLKNIKNRILSLKGHTNFISSCGNGFLLTVEFPVATTNI